MFPNTDLYYIVDFDKRSSLYNTELKTLIEMDIRLKLLELQHIGVPKNPPHIPPLPADLRPSLPPKPLGLGRTRKR